MKITYPELIEGKAQGLGITAKALAHALGHTVDSLAHAIEDLEQVFRRCLLAPTELEWFLERNDRDGVPYIRMASWEGRTRYVFLGDARQN